MRLKISSKARKRFLIRQQEKTIIRAELLPSPLIGFGPRLTPIYAVRELKVLFFWLHKKFNNNPVYNHSLARELDIHAICAEAWIDALRKNSYLVIGPTGSLVVRKLTSKEEIDFTDTVIKIKAPTEYDPWTNRKYDYLFSDPWFPFFIDRYVDKYYRADYDECKIFEGRRRVRSDNNLFLPVIFTDDTYDHPLYHEKDKGLSSKTNCYRCPSPPLSRKLKIEKATAGRRAGIRKRTGSEEIEQETVKNINPWYNFDKKEKARWKRREPDKITHEDTEADRLRRSLERRAAELNIGH